MLLLLSRPSRLRQVSLVLPWMVVGFLGYAQSSNADSMSALIAQKTAQNNAQRTPTPTANVTTHTTITRAPTTDAASYHDSSQDSYNYSSQDSYSAPTNTSSSHRYPEVQRAPSVLPAFLSGTYDNVDSEYLPILSRAEQNSSAAASKVIKTARAMTLNERAIIQGGCWDYLDAVFKRAGVTRDTLHKGTYAHGPYAHSSEIQAGDWLYYINHGYHGVEHSGLFVGWVDEASRQALILSYAGENRREPARYRVYDLSNVYQIMRPSM